MQVFNDLLEIKTKPDTVENHVICSILNWKVHMIISDGRKFLWLFFIHPEFSLQDRCREVELEIRVN